MTILIAACSLPVIVILDDPLTAGDHNELGVIYEQKGMYDLAEKEYGKALDKDKKWFLPCFNMGNLCYKKGDYAGAETFYRQALARDEGNIDVMNNLAWLLFERGCLEEARELIKKVAAESRKQEHLDTYQKIMGEKR